MAVFLFVLVLSCGSATATTINVHPGINTIKTAINNVHSGDTLNLSAGTYKEHDLVINKNITVTGPTTTGTQTAIIDAQQQGRAFNINPNIQVNLKYIIIENGNANKETDIQEGGAIRNQGILTIRNCRITKNTAYDGGGIFNEDCGTVTITDSIINSNTAYSLGGGIYNGGIYIGDCGTVNMTNSIISNNTATYYGGGIYNYGTCNFTNSIINSNTATNGGGIENFIILTFKGSTIKGNIANGYGGGIYNYYSGTVTVTNSTINSNTANNSYGGGIYNDRGKITITNSIVQGNTAYYDGGGIYNYFVGTVTIINSTIKGNSSYYGNGGGIYNSQTLKVSGCEFLSNKATSKGNAIYNYNGGASVNHNRFYNSKIGYEIYCNTGIVNAKYNWWGTNINPKSKVYGNVTVTPWLDNTPPKITSTNPKNGSTGVARNKTITVTFNEIIKKSSKCLIELKASNGKKVTITTVVSGKVLIIKHTAKLKAKTKYTLTIYKCSVTDKEGNPVAAKTITFTAGSN